MPEVRVFRSLSGAKNGHCVEQRECFGLQCVCITWDRKQIPSRGQCRVLLATFSQGKRVVKVKVL